MKSKKRFVSGQFQLPLARESGDKLDEQTRARVVDALASLLLEALGDERDEQTRGKEAGHASENNP